MNKRGIFVSLVAGLLTFPSVFAQDNAFTNIGESLFKVFGWVFVDLSQHIGDDIYFFWTKFLLFVLLLSVYFYGALKVFKETQRKIATTVALVLALMSVLLMPNELLIGIMKTYTVIAAVAVMAIPIFAVFMINHYSFKGEDNPAFSGVRAILYLLIAFVFGNIAGFERFLDFKYFASWAGFAEALCIIAVIYNLIKMVTGVTGAGVAPTWPTRARPGAPPARPGEPEYPNHLVTIRNRIQGDLAQFQHICDRYKGDVSQVLHRNRQIVQHYGLGACDLRVARNITAPTASGPMTRTIGPDPHLVDMLDAAANSLAAFDHSSDALRTLCTGLFNHADFTRLNDHDRERAVELFTDFSNLEAETLLFRLAAYDRYMAGEVL